ncbi:MAG: ADP-ribosylglycohydrolase family protein [Alphaproteobacteria bacterium]
MIGAIAGDIIGSPYEGQEPPPQGFPLFRADSCFTDDTVCTLAIADAVMGACDYAHALQYFVRRYPNAGYGPAFKRWALGNAARPYGSNGNGAAMRVAAIGWSATGADDALRKAAASARVSHDHPDAIRAAQAVALAIWLSRMGSAANTVRDGLAERLAYAVPSDPKPFKGFDATAAGSVPSALACALLAANWEDAVRRAVALGGDTDTLACISGAVAEALHGIPRAIEAATLARLPPDLADVIARFRRQHRSRRGRLTRLLRGRLRQ